MITQAFVTTSVRRWLMERDWTILSMDYPESGTGVLLHPRGSRSKTAGAVKPDLIARKGAYGIIVESHERFSLSDFRKLAALRKSDEYTDSLARVFGGALPSQLAYGAIFADVEYQVKRAQRYLNLVDFVLAVNADGNTRIVYERVYIPWGNASR